MDTVVEPPIIVATGRLDIIRVPYLTRTVAELAVEHLDPAVSIPSRWVLPGEAFQSVVERRCASITVVNRDPIIALVAGVLNPFVLVDLAGDVPDVPPPVGIGFPSHVPTAPDEEKRMWSGRLHVTPFEFLNELEGEVVCLGHWHLDPDILADHAENIPIHIQLLPDPLELLNRRIGQPGRSVLRS